MECIKKTENDKKRCAITYTGIGNRAFCAEADIVELEKRTLQSEMDPTPIFEENFIQLSNGYQNHQLPGLMDIVTVREWNSSWKVRCQLEIVIPP